MKVRTTIAALAAILAISTAHAADAIVEVQSVKPAYPGAPFLEAIVKVTNISTTWIKAIYIECALDSVPPTSGGQSTVADLGPRESGYASVPVMLRNNPASRDVQCHVDDVDR